MRICHSRLCTRDTLHSRLRIPRSAALRRLRKPRTYRRLSTTRLHSFRMCCSYRGKRGNRYSILRTRRSEVVLQLRSQRTFRNSRTIRRACIHCNIRSWDMRRHYCNMRRIPRNGVLRPQEHNLSRINNRHTIRCHIRYNDRTHRRTKSTDRHHRNTHRNRGSVLPYQQGN